VIAYLLRRLSTVPVVIALALTLAFVVLRGLPGDAVDSTLALSGAGPDEIALRRDQLGLNDPLSQQYLAYLVGVVRGDWGESLISGQPVTELIAQNAAPTLVLALAGLLIALAVGVGLGLVAGIVRLRPLRLSADALIALALSTPVYWTATLAIYLFTVKLRLLPGVSGTGVRALLLPACVLGFHAAGGIAQVTASSLRETITQDFVRTARAKGLSDLDVLDHVLRVGLLPVIAVVALQLGFLLGGTVITETIFVRRGLGRVLLAAVRDRDYPVVQGLVILSALVYSLLNALADVLYGLVDPRVEIER